jgi:murein DD-endopeptidase MepM/ murein hydrolase activator NlpD
MGRRTGRGATKALSALAALAILPLVGVLAPAPQAALAASSTTYAPSAPAASAASATTYPTWQDVANAQANEAAAAGQVAAIKALLAKLTAEFKSTQAEADKKGQIYADAQDKFDAQAYITDQLQTQADAAQKEAAASKKAASQLLSELGRTGGSGNDLTASLLTQSGNADSLLYRLGAMNKLSERSADVYSQALQQQKNAQALTDQATVAKKKLNELKVIAEKALQVAQAAATAAQAKYDEQQAHAAQLEAQLKVLSEKRAATQADYTAGIKAMWGPNAGGIISATGWARPVSGHITSPFGMRFHPIYHRWILHSGTDIAGAGCGATIYAAHSGVVTYAGPNGTLGNYVQIDHQNGTSSGYGHIMPGGIHVSIGQHVDPGQPIAQEGTTGASTGCHVHFIIRINGQLTDPVPFMRNQGIGIS